ncbi:MAG: SDR family NAD(P)-dependent oxidoreductase [Clostridia bacterium]|nr:SDR family NAD(P)-dependent oxidoreductase [Clostridia bacterium]
MIDNKVAIVTGSSSGIGKAIAKILSDNGYTVYGFSRSGSGEENIKNVSVDVSDESAVECALDEVAKEAGKINLVVNCAGFGISGACEFTKADDARKQLDVNIIGTANVCKASIKYLRETKGTIINTSSVAGVVAIPFQTWYSVSKFGINAYTEALAIELQPFGIQVCAIMPGDTKTGFTQAREKQVIGDDVYGGKIGRSVSSMEHDEQNGASPEVIAKYVYKLTKKKHLKPLYTPTFGFRVLTWVAKLLPCRAIKFIVKLLYAS